MTPCAWHYDSAVGCSIEQMTSEAFFKDLDLHETCICVILCDYKVDLIGCDFA